jgi:hypothetical protein
MMAPETPESPKTPESPETARSPSSADESEGPTEDQGSRGSLARREPSDGKPARDIAGWYQRQDDAGRTDTTATLEPLQHATAEQWLGSNNDPDVLLSVPNLGVDHIGIEVDNLRAHVDLRAKVLDLLELHVGADVSIDRVAVDIENVRVQAMLKVRLDNVVHIVNRVMDTIDANPEILTNLTAGLGKGLEGGLGQEHAVAIEEGEGRLKGVESDE